MSPLLICNWWGHWLVCWEVCTALLICLSSANLWVHHWHFEIRCVFVIIVFVLDVSIQHRVFLCCVMLLCALRLCYMLIPQSSHCHSYCILFCMGHILFYIFLSLISNVWSAEIMTEECVDHIWTATKGK